MKIVISENQFNLIKKDIEEDYPISWNIEEFKKLKSFNQRIKYCQEHLQRISSGSSRIVYKVDDTKVLKLARNKKGLAQNEVEIGFSEDYLWDGIIAEIFDHEENGLWIEMELARKVTPKIFKDITGVSFEDYCNAITYYDGETKGKRNYFIEPENMSKMWENEFVYEILNIIGGYDNVSVGDLCKLSTYGVVNRNGSNVIVMIDYGLTNQVYDSYYK